MKKTLKTTASQMAFYKLYKSYKTNKETYLKTWEFVGELHISELNEWCLMSYKCPARLSDIFLNNNGLLERRQSTAKSGEKYYEYRINQNVKVDMIQDKHLLEFYLRIKQ